MGQFRFDSGHLSTAAKCANMRIGRCIGPSGKRTWRLAWDREGRIAAWALSAAAENADNVFGGSKYLWGNVPAIDALHSVERKAVLTERT
jgi:hypothetical protein